MITEDKRFINIQGILAMSDVHPADCIKINDLIIELSKENQELKKENEEYKRLGFKHLQNRCNELEKQLEEYQLQNIDLRADIMIEKKSFPNKLIKDKTFYNLYDMPTYEDLLNQQKEFIKYLEEKEKEFDILGDPKNAGACKGIRKKYQEIIGVTNE